MRVATAARSLDGLQGVGRRRHHVVDPHVVLLMNESGCPDLAWVAMPRRPPGVSAERLSVRIPRREASYTSVTIGGRALHATGAT